MGDPCAPPAYIWEGLECNSTRSTARITSINLASSGLSGALSEDFKNFQQLTYLDLSHNNLNGIIPDIWSGLTSLRVLDLSNNHFTGSLPSDLQDRANSRSLQLRVDCDISGKFCEQSNIAAIVAPVVVVVVLATAAILIYLIIRRKRRQHGVVSAAAATTTTESTVQVVEVQKLTTKIHQYTYKQLQNITRDFTRLIGKGGFGSVYYGTLADGLEVAVKLCSVESSEGAKQFRAEVENLTQVNHRNLVDLLGYCNEKGHLALVYEFMAKGSLADHLTGNSTIHTFLSWQMRLRIAVEAAQGLDYLHTGCKIVNSAAKSPVSPRGENSNALIHRDVKSSNILLDQNLHAKVADFGLAKLSDDLSTITFSGTPGYIDPVYQMTLLLSEKSDVYSFGVVLLEIVTGKPAIIKKPGQPNLSLSSYVSQEINRGNLEPIVDAAMHGEFDTGSVWKVLDLATRCTAERWVQRPTMAQVAMELKDCLATETARVQGGRRMTEGDTCSSASNLDVTSGSFVAVAR